MKKYLYILGVIILIFISSYTFSKFFPSESGTWDANMELKDINLTRTGWSDEGFWTTVDFPQKQKVCIGVNTDKVNVKRTSKTLTFTEKGTLEDLFRFYSAEKIENSLEEEKPFIISHLRNSTTRHKKSIFFLGENNKYLIPTSNIYAAIFPNTTSPLTKAEPKLAYSNITIGFPEGALISHKEGVFVISDNKKSLIRSPEIFESFGYDWGEILEANQFEAKLQSNHKNPLEFFFPHPNGTIIQREEDLFFVWDQGLYTLTIKDKEKYFKYNPIVLINEHETEVECKNNKCCLDYDPRINPPNYFNFNNTLVWYINKQDSVDWKTKRKVNIENLMYRLRGLKYKFTFLYS